MSDPTPIPPAPTPSTTTMDPIDPTIPPVTEAPRPVTDASRSTPLLDNVTPEKPRTHPVAYGALALATLAFILSVFALTRHNDDGFRQVRVGNNDCVIGQQADNVDVLYCRTPAP